MAGTIAFGDKTLAQTQLRDDFGRVEAADFQDLLQRGGDLLGQLRVLLVFPTTYNILTCGDYERIVVTNICFTCYNIGGGGNTHLLHTPKGGGISGNDIIYQRLASPAWSSALNVMGTPIYLTAGEKIQTFTSKAASEVISIYGARLSVQL